MTEQLLASAGLGARSQVEGSASYQILSESDGEVIRQNFEAIPWPGKTDPDFKAELLRDMGQDWNAQWFGGKKGR